MFYVLVEKFIDVCTVSTGSGTTDGMWSEKKATERPLTTIQRKLMRERRNETMSKRYSSIDGLSILVLVRHFKMVFFMTR